MAETDFSWMRAWDLLAPGTRPNLAAVFPDFPARRCIPRSDGFRIQDHYSPVKITNQLIARQICLKCRDERQHVSGNRGFEPQKRPSTGMREPKAGGVQSLPREVQ